MPAISTESISMLDFDTQNSNLEFTPTETVTHLVQEGAITTTDTNELLQKEAPIIVHNISEVNEQITSHFTEILQTNFESFAYHNIEHSNNVLELSMTYFDALSATDTGKKLLLETNVASIQDPEQQLALLRCYVTALALGHDIVQSVAINPSTGMLERNRGMGEGQSEGESARYIYSYLRKFTYADGRPVFDNLTSQTVLHHIDATNISASIDYIHSPYVRDDEKVLIIKTPAIDENSDAIDFIIACADLKRASGGDNTTAFIEEGYAEFRELNPWLQELAAKGVDNLSYDELARAGTAILKWTAMQKGFAAAQRELFSDFMSKVKSDELASVLKTKINEQQFDTNISAVTFLAEMQEYTYRLSIISAEINNIKEQETVRTLTDDERYKLLSLQGSFVRLSRTGQYVIPGNGRFADITGSAKVDAHKAIKELFHQAGFNQ